MVILAFNTLKSPTEKVLPSINQILATLPTVSIWTSVAMIFPATVKSPTVKAWADVGKMNKSDKISFFINIGLVCTYLPIL